MQMQSPALAELSQSDRIHREEVLYKAGKNYIKQARYQNKYIVRWNKTEFPIKIYVGNGKGIPNYYTSAFIYAPMVWKDESEGIIDFQLVREEKDANISFRILDKNAEGDTLAYTTHEMQGSKLLRSVIYVYKRDSKGNYFKPNDLLNIMVHEFGHALGIIGHATDPESIMYESYSVLCEKTSPFLYGSDINTLRLLYKIVPDITNGDKNKEKDNWITPQILF